MAVTITDVEFLIQNEILPKLDWEFPSRGLFDEGSGDVIQSQVDQLIHRIPFRPVSSAGLEVPRITSSNDSLYVDELGSQSFVDVDLSLSSENFTMKSVAATLQIPSAALGADYSEEMLEEFKRILAKIMQRFLSVSVIYGGYNIGGWAYYRPIPVPTPIGWSQNLSFDGFNQKCGIPEASPGAFNEGYSLLLNQALTLENLDNFLRQFKGPANGKIDYLVMNWEMKEFYLGLWRAVGQLPQYVVDPTTGELCVAHDGVPILVNDYIMTYDMDPANQEYIKNTSNPENVNGNDADRQTSIYALTIGEEKGGVFGIYPSSLGAAPLMIEEGVSSQSDDTILIRGKMEAGLVTKTRSGVGRLGGILLNPS